MAKKLGNDYRLWIESSTPGTYNQILGQQSLSYSRSSNQIDVSDKNNSPYALSAAGLFDVSISLEGLADLPDATGYTLLETKFLAQTAVEVPDQEGRHLWRGRGQGVRRDPEHPGAFDRVPAERGGQI
jgi:predicted secreted protein